MTMMADVLGIFASLIRTQLEFRVYTTKESIRYTFLAAILAGTSLGPQDITLNGLTQKLEERKSTC
jgi:hypothetical protein